MWMRPPAIRSEVMTMRSRILGTAIFALATALIVGCSSTAVSPRASSAAASAAPASPPAAASASTTGGVTVEAKPVGAIGLALVDGKTGLTVYIFTKDVKDSGKSVCSGGCLETWPALTVPAGATPSGGTGVTGKFGTITRDDGTLQVTYNGLPLYFFKNDKAPGDANGVYENWEAVKP